MNQELLSYLRTDVFGEPFPAFPVVSSAELSKASLLLLIKVLADREKENKMSQAGRGRQRERDTDKCKHMHQLKSDYNSE